MVPGANIDATAAILDGSMTVDEERRALTSGAVLVERSDVGRLIVTGDDGLDLLNRLSTNELATLEVGEGAATVLTTNKGRIVDLLHVHRRQDRLVVFTSARNEQRVAQWIDFYTFVEDVSVDDVTRATAMLSLCGPGSGSLLDEFTMGKASSLAPLGRLDVDMAGVSADVYRSDFLGTLAFDLVIDAEHMGRVVAILAGVGAVSVDEKAIEAFRVARGIPAFGKELTEDYNPHEANLVHHVSFSKGCYIGQEVIARLQTYKKVSKYLVGLRWEGDGPKPGSFLSYDGKRMGVVTSRAQMPLPGESVGLGYVKKAFAENGKTVVDEAGNEIEIRTLV